MVRSILHSTGNNEWYTPPEIIELAREVLGGTIDLDPCSNEIAQKWIKARHYFSLDNPFDLSTPLEERYLSCWCNPPYSNTEQWIDKIVAEWERERIGEVIFLVKPSVGTRWFNSLSRRFPVCFYHGRIKFINPSKDAFSPAHGNAFFYLGQAPQLFVEVFSFVGCCLAAV